MHQFRSGGHTNYKHCNKIFCGDVYNRVNLLMFHCTCVSLCASSRLIKQTSWEWVLWRLPKEQKKRREESTRLDRPLFFFLGGVGGGEGDVYWHLPLPFHCWREKVGLNMTRGSRIPITEIHQNEHTVSLSPAEHLSSPPADIKTFSGHRAFHTLSHTHTHQDHSHKHVP